MIDVEWLNLDEATITRRCADLRSDMGGVWWQTTWSLVRDPASAQFVGQEGPQSVDHGERVAHLVARTAGWPIN
jgi:hypothetical protein